jgi:hypothetical protein
LIEEEAEGQIAADECGEDGEDYGLYEPDGIDYLGLGGGLCGVIMLLSGGAGHESFFMNFSIGRLPVVGDS